MLAEIQRACAALPAEGPITKDAFNSVSRVNATTCQRHFGSWKATLEAAGLGDRYGGPATISAKMLACKSRYLTNEELLDELRRVAGLVGGIGLTVRQVEEHSTAISGAVVRSRFGSWRAALVAAGIPGSSHGNRWTEEDYFENLLAVWTHCRRAPRYAEMQLAPSLIGGSTYVKKFGSWTAAKHAFSERITSDIRLADAGQARPSPSSQRTLTSPSRRAEDQREIRLGLRYEVLRRDHFKCVTCGRTATDIACVLHVDHVEPFSKGGKTEKENLRSLCDFCNLGKGDRPA